MSLDSEDSIVPRLIETQEKFISLLDVADSSPSAWRTVLQATIDLPANLFLKHLMVLADISGEKLKNHRRQLRQAFPAQQMDFIWRDQQYGYRFNTLEGRAWNNKTLLVDADGLVRRVALTPILEDVAMFILFGSLAQNTNLPGWVMEGCILGTLLGRKTELTHFVRERYIWVSEITKGATANNLGQLAQGFVKNRLQSLLPEWNFDGHTIPGFSQNANNVDTSFDMVARSPSGKYCAIEVSFQVTTNSTIERKADQARPRRELLHPAGHHIAYVIDGAGNFFRRPAITKICNHSDCTVTFKDAELVQLAGYLRSLETPSLKKP